jgi:hypothetical protein
MNLLEGANPHGRNPNKRRLLVGLLCQLISNYSGPQI